MILPISELHFLLLIIAMLLMVISSYWIWKAKRSTESNLNKFIKWFSSAVFLITVNIVIHFLLQTTGFIKGEELYYICYLFFILAAFCFARSSMYLDELYKESDFMSLVKEKMQNQTEEFFEEAKE